MENLNKKFKKCLAFLTIPLSFFCSAAFGGVPTTPGPFITYEESAPALVIDKSENQQKLPEQQRRKVAIKRLSTDIIAPIPYRILGGMLVVKAAYRRETRAWTRDGDTLQSSGDLDTPELLAPGLIFLPHAAEGGPRWFLMATRYGSGKTRETAKFMAEALVGFDLMDRIPLTFANGDTTRTRFLIRQRKFPHAVRWLVLAEHSIYSPAGWHLSLSIPSHLIGGWESQNGDFAARGGLRLESKEYPFNAGDSSSLTDETKFGWFEGYTTTVFSGVRHRMRGALFAAGEIGATMENLSTYAESGTHLASHSTNLVPFIKIALETHFVTP